VSSTVAVHVDDDGVARVHLDRELVRVTKRTLLESAALTDADEAAEAELVVHQ
jgi:hypothetical protein